MNRIWLKTELTDDSSLAKRRRTPVISQTGIDISFCLVVPASFHGDLDVLKKNLTLIAKDTPNAEVIILAVKGKYDQALKSIITEHQNLVHAYHYEANMSERSLRNQCVQKANGQVLFFLDIEDQLCLKPASYIINQVTRFPGEEVLIMEKPFRRLVRIGLLRNTFYELGGFDESIAYANQIAQLVARLKRYGVNPIRITREHYTKTKAKRGLVFFAPSASNIRNTHFSKLNIEKVVL